jgi:aminocarboxymuconate-semialdehyde decarboxylase
VLGRSLADPAFKPLLAELDRRHAVLYVHPVGCGAGSPLIVESHLTWMVGAPVEDTVSIMQMILAGIPSRYPHMKIINSHLGGALPMILQRADNQYGWAAPDSPEKPSTAARRMWYDTVGHGHPPALRAAVDSFGADRLLLGTDFPYESGDVFRTAVTYIEQSGLDPEQARQILDGNALGVLGL